MPYNFDLYDVRAANPRGEDALFYDQVGDEDRTPSTLWISVARLTDSISG